MTELTMTDMGKVAVSVSGSVIKAEHWDLVKQAALAGERINTLRQEAITRGEEAEQRGYAEGFEAGRQAAKEELTAELLKVAETANDNMARQSNDIIEIALGVTRKLMGIHPDRRWFIELVKQAVAENQALHFLKLRVHPDMVATAEQNLRELNDMNPVVQNIQVITDDTLDPLESIVESETGHVHASLDRQLAAIRAALMAG